MPEGGNARVATAVGRRSVITAGLGSIAAAGLGSLGRASSVEERTAGGKKPPSIAALTFDVFGDTSLDPAIDVTAPDFLELATALGA